MNRILPLTFLLLAGCQTPPAAKLTPPRPVATADAPSAAPAVVQPAPTIVIERRLRLQAQYIEALLSQNETLTAQVAAGREAKPASLPAAPDAASPATPSIQPSPASSCLAPNADGVIDLATAVMAEKSDEAVNPFAIRSVDPKAVREVTLQVSGIVAGPARCAVINGRLLQAGDVTESLTVERIEPEAVVFVHATQRLRVPVGKTTVRVRLPL